MSHGPRCKILIRHFHPKDLWTGSWAWLPALNPCSKLVISLEILTKSINGMILSSNPAGSSGIKLELTNGKPRIEIRVNGTSIATTAPTDVSDLKWHLIEIHWEHEVRH